MLFYVHMSPLGFYTCRTDCASRRLIPGNQGPSSSSTEKAWHGPLMKKSNQPRNNAAVALNTKRENMRGCVGMAYLLNTTYYLKKRYVWYTICRYLNSMFLHFKFNFLIKKKMVPTSKPVWDYSFCRTKREHWSQKHWDIY